MRSYCKRHIKVLYVITYLVGIGMVMSCETSSSVEPRFEDYFIKYHGGDGNQVGVALVEYNDGFVLLGNSTLLNGRSKLFVVHTDALGNEVWSDTFGGDLSVNAVDVAIDNNNNIVIASNVEIAPGDLDLMFFKINPNGEKLDSLIFGAPGHRDVANNLLITANGDYVITGYTTNVDRTKPGYDPNTDFEDILSIRVTSALELYEPANWRRIYGFSGIDRGVGLVQKENGSFLFFGTTDRIPTGSTPPPELNMFMFPAGSDGVATSASPFQWFGSSQADENGASISSTATQGFAMIGTSEESNATTNPFFVVVGASDNLINSALVSTVNNVESVAIVQDNLGGFLILGNEQVNNASNIFLARTSFNGVLEWNRSFGGTDNDFAGSLLELPDGAIVMVGTIQLENQTKLTLIKTTSQGLLSP